MKWTTFVRNFLTAMVLCVVFVGCGGVCSDSVSEQEAWVLSGSETGLIAAGTSRTFVGILENLSNNNSHSITVTKKSAPGAWTVTHPTGTLLLGRPQGTKIEIEVTVSIPAGAPAVTLPVVMEVKDTAGKTVNWTISVTVGAAAIATGLREVMAMTASGGEIFEGQAEASNGEGVPICTMLDVTPTNFTLETDALIWMRPNSGGFCADPGTTDLVTLAGLPRSNLTARTFTQQFHFNWGANRFAYTTSWSVPAATDVGYRINSIDHWIGQRTTDPDTTATYNVTVDPVLTGRAGQYTFSVDGLAPEFSATVNPATAAVNAAGDPVTVEVTITRVAYSVREQTDEFTLRANHESAADINLALKLPVRNMLGRLARPRL